MAPFSKGRVQASEGVVSRAKGGGNKKSFRDDRKRTGSGTRGRNKPYFNTTRIKEQVDDNLSQSEGTPLRNEAIEDYYDQTSSDEEPREVSDSPIKPYNSLLKSLSARNQYEQHQRKKQKLYDKEPSKYSDLIEENADLGLESDDSESSITDNVNDHEVSNMAEDGISCRNQMERLTNCFRS